MVEGHIRDNGDAVVPLIIRGFGGQELVIEAVVDTGFNGELTLTTDQVTTLGLAAGGGAALTLTNDIVIEVTTYTAIVVWDGVQRLVRAAGDDAEPLIGLAMLRGYKLSVDVVDGGAVRISRLGGELIPATEDTP